MPPVCAATRNGERAEEYPMARGPADQLVFGIPGPAGLTGLGSFGRIRGTKKVSGTFFNLSFFTDSRLDFQKRFLTPFLNPNPVGLASG
jgi:hypothetical protein